MTTDERFEAMDTKVSKLTESLETSVRRQRITIAALVVVAVVTAVMAAGPPPEEATFDQITAKGLQIVNDAGEQQAYLGADEDGGGLGIWNKTGEEVVQLRVERGTGNGFVAAFNRYGKGKTLKPGRN